MTNKNYLIGWTHKKWGKRWAHHVNFQKKIKITLLTKHSKIIFLSKCLYMVSWMQRVNRNLCLAKSSYCIDLNATVTVGVDTEEMTNYYFHLYLSLCSPFLLPLRKVKWYFRRAAHQYQSIDAPARVNWAMRFPLSLWAWQLSMRYPPAHKNHWWP